MDILPRRSAALHLHLTLTPGSEVRYNGADGSSLIITCKPLPDLEELTAQIQEHTTKLEDVTNPQEI